MNTMGRRATFEQILVDLNTQCDFLLPGGALPVANRAEVLPNVRRLMNWARTRQIPVISSLEAHRHGESFRSLPPHCIDRTLGQRKLPFTLMPQRLVLQGDNTSDVPSDPFRKYQQIIFTKRNADFLTNPKADRLINATHADSWILFGVTSTHCVKSVALGLMARHHRVIVIRDACGCWSMTDGEHALRQMEAKGAVIVTTDEVISGAATERINLLIQEEAQRQAELAAASSREKPAPVAAPLNRASEATSPSAKANGHGKRDNGSLLSPAPNGKANGIHAANGHSTNGEKTTGHTNGRVAKSAGDTTSGRKVVPPHLVRKQGRSDGAQQKPR